MYQETPPAGMSEMRQRLKPIVTRTGGGRGRGGEVAALEEPLSPGSRIFHEKDFNIHVLAILGCKTKVDIETIKANFPSTLLKHPRFSSVVVGDASKGEELRWRRLPNVNPLDHIVLPEIGPEAEADPDKFLEDYIYDLSKTSLDRSKPLWDVHILNLKTSHSEAAGVFRLHHSLGDGTSLMSLLLACTRQIADPTLVPTTPATRTNRPKKKEEEERKAWWWVRLMLAVWMVIQLCWNTVVDVAAFIATSVFLKDTATPLKGGPGVEYTPRRVVFRTVSLDDIKLIKNAINGTINDAALGITQAGLSKYLNRKYGDEKKNNLPKNIRLRSTLLINLRPTAGIQALADMMEKNTEAKWGNWIGFVLLPFTIGLRKDPLEYIREAKATIDRKKRSLEAIYTFTISEIALKLFGVKASGAMSHRVIANTTMCFSNLVGPLEEIGFYGHQLQFLAPSSYGQPHSYVDKMTIVASVDEDVIPDGRQLLDDIVESLGLIKEAVLAKGLA
ncbi:hypothetical protein V2J09_001587 [Rumex salicifolius]